MVAASLQIAWICILSFTIHAVCANLTTKRNEVIEESYEDAQKSLQDYRARSGYVSDRVVFSETKPTHIPMSVQVQMKKRSLSENTFGSACSSESDWEIMTTAPDIDGNTIYIAPHFKGKNNKRKQFVYVTRCVNEGQQCTGFRETSTNTSQCKEKLEWHLILGRNIGDTKSRWDYGALPSCCSCAVTRPTILAAL